ncbi:hypothetical protein BC628DRAFT_807262 [Trametes gibbosa]|nr:hypothetical protein BC628DRAFT_807262 [Trametes gibbosa]
MMSRPQGEPPPGRANAMRIESTLPVLAVRHAFILVRWAASPGGGHAQPWRGACERRASQLKVSAFETLEGRVYGNPGHICAGWVLRRMRQGREEAHQDTNAELCADAGARSAELCPTRAQRRRSRWVRCLRIRRLDSSFQSGLYLITPSLISSLPIRHHAYHNGSGPSHDTRSLGVARRTPVRRRHGTWVHRTRSYEDEAGRTVPAPTAPTRGRLHDCTSSSVLCLVRPAARDTVRSNVRGAHDAGRPDVAGRSRSRSPRVRGRVRPAGATPWVRARPRRPSVG